jgi:hypothetical protein
MKDYREMTISGPQDLLVATVAEIEKSLNDGWERNRQTEEKSRPQAGLSSDALCFCFTCAPNACRRGALLVLMSNRDGNLWLSNIVPNEMGRLTYDEFNYIFEEFLQKFAKSAAAKTGVAIRASSGVVTLEDWFSPATANKLRRFLTLSHGSTIRTDDRERWMEFLIAAHREGAEVHGDVLRRWLEEDARCDEDDADDLARDYQRSQEILNFEEQYQGA